ncbi:MAG TPA: asparagine synthase C-terminal domain-containing protein, partial [Asticcacaulis sp.]|nr:asparagine synthase C-terminal domain-containing protein [Asticcacaulis sp.]
QPPEGFEDLELTLTAPGLCVYRSSDAMCRIPPKSRGVVIGDLFTREDTPRPIATFDAATALNILSTRGRSLLSSHWGQYVAISRSPESGDTHVLRDPSGGLPCYILRHRDAIYIGSDIALLFSAARTRPSVDSTRLLRFLFAFDLRTPETCLAGVEELLAGCALDLGGARNASTPVWSPWDHVQASDERGQSPERLANTLDACVRAWTQVYRRPLLTVSGGLDSSILAACLVATDATASYLTLATEDPVGDERVFARALADHLHLDLREDGYAMADIDLETPTSAHLPRPTLHALSAAEYACRRRHTDMIGANALMTGIGGDNVFCSMSSATPILDRWRVEGPGVSVWRTLNDVCHLTGCSYLQAGRMATARALSGKTAYRWEGNPQFLNLDALRAARFDLNHPWLAAPNGALPGKAAHIAKLVRIQATIDGFPRRGAPPQIHPLLSQPVVETCLAVPTWAWIAGGQNRSVARQAFADRLPELILNRRTKGGPDSFAFDIVDTHRARLRERLLDGELARRGLLDLDALDAALHPDRTVRALDYMRLSALIEAETWTRRMSDGWVTAPPEGMRTGPS